VHRLIYKSRSTEKIDKESVRDILYKSQEMNRKSFITGALLATNSHFLQILEGEFEAVNETFFRIVHDPRHGKVELISFGPIEKRLFDKWTMKAFGLFNLNKEMESILKEKYGEEEGGVNFPLDELLVLSLIDDVSMMDKSPMSS
jgi:hypothetical protein